MNYPLVVQPQRININLYKHQLTSIYNMEKLEDEKMIKLSNTELVNTRIGILADLTGYGKTLSILGLIDRDRMHFNLEDPFLVKTYTGNGIINLKTYKLYTKINSNLIVLNNSLLLQWVAEIKKTSLTYIIIDGKKDIDEVEPDKYDITICNKNIYSLLLSRFRNYCWKRLILDEPLTLKINDFNNYAFGFIWCVTATPYEMVAKTKSTTIFEDLFAKNEYLLNQSIIRNPDKYVKESFNMPDTQHFYYECYNPLVKILDGIISPVLLELINAGNIKEAIKFLGGVTDSESLYYLVKQKKIQKIEEIDKQLEQRKNDEEKDNTKLLLKKENLKQQIIDLEHRLNNELKNDCIICHSELQKPMFLSCCQNIICSECILTWINTKENCPLCRSELSSKNLTLIDEQFEKQKTVNCEKKLKPDIILDILKGNNYGKFIIFSNYDESFSSVKKILDEKKINYCELKGGKDKRNRDIESFKNDDVNVLFLNSKENAAGINLQETTDIILYHNMNEYNLTQIMGRANRIGRKKPLKVHHLI